jgi:hypothetical protein
LEGLDLAQMSFLFLLLHPCTLQEQK